MIDETSRRVVLSTGPQHHPEHQAQRLPSPPTYVHAQRSPTLYALADPHRFQESVRPYPDLARTRNVVGNRRAVRPLAVSWTACRHQIIHSGEQPGQNVYNRQHPILFIPNIAITK